MYLNYKYTSYTEVGKAGVWPQAKFLHYSLFSSLLPPFPCCILVLCHLQKTSRHSFVLSISSRYDHGKNESLPSVRIAGAS